MLEGVLHLPSVEVIVETRRAENRIREEMSQLRRDYQELDLRSSALQRPGEYPRLLSIWDKNRPVTITDLIAATNLLYKEGTPDEEPENASNASEST